MNDDPVTSLLNKMEKWLDQQPEWRALLSLPRKERRDAAKKLAWIVFSYPRLKQESDRKEYSGG